MTRRELFLSNQDQVARTFNWSLRLMSRMTVEADISISVICINIALNVTVFQSVAYSIYLNISVSQDLNFSVLVSQLKMLRI